MKLKIEIDMPAVERANLELRRGQLLWDPLREAINQTLEEIEASGDADGWIRITTGNGNKRAVGHWEMV